MAVSTSYFSNCAVVSFHQEVKNLFSSLPPQGKITEVARRVVIAVVAPFAYLVLGIAAFIGFLNPFRATVITQVGAAAGGIKAGTQAQAGTQAGTQAQVGTKAGTTTGITSSNQTYYVRFLAINLLNKHFSTPLNLHIANELNTGIKEDIKDHQAGYHKGACLYTPQSIQPLAAFDPRHDPDTTIRLDYPFAVIIDPKVKLHYWSLRDIDRNAHRAEHEQMQQKKLKKYKPTAFHTLSQISATFMNWRTIHFTAIEAFLEKIDNVIKAAKNPNQTYLTAGGHEKQIDDLKEHHNEAVISYHPEKDILGFLIDRKNIADAQAFKENYKDQAGKQVFKNAFLAYQDANGKIVRI